MSSVFRRLLSGVVAGAAGTLAMDLVWYARYRRGGGEDGFADWEFATSTTSFEEASAPAKVARRAADAIGIDLPDEAAGTATNVMHWLTGTGYGLGHSLLLGRRGVVTGGALTATGAFANSYALLGAMGLYKPIWEYDATTLAKDYSAHLAFGLATAATARLLASSDD